MPRRKSDNNDNKFGEYRTVTLDFSDAERNQIIEYCDERLIDLTSRMEEWTSDGWKISISYSVGWGNYVCSITAKEVKNRDSRTIYLFRHMDFSRIVGFLQFFFGVMVENDDARLRGNDTTHDW